MAERIDNYQISRERAQAYFLGFDQQVIIDAWKLRHDEQYLYTDFLGRSYRICRCTGMVLRPDGREAGFEEALSIFDLLCHEGSVKHLSGTFAPVNSLKGRPRAIGVGTDFHSDFAARFDQDWDAFRCACFSLGGTSMALGDIGFSFPVFGDLTVRMKFYGSDEDFPASAVLLWDENMLQYVFYETVFYIAGFLFRSILEQLPPPISKEEIP